MAIELMSCKDVFSYNALQRYAKISNYRIFYPQTNVFLDKICLKYARNGDSMLSSQEKSVPLQGNMPEFI